MSDALLGLRIWLTRPGDSGERSAEVWRASGAEVLWDPTLRLEPRDPDPTQLAILSDPHPRAIVALTSPFAAENFARFLELASARGRSWRCVAVGEATAERARRAGLEVAWIAARATGRDLAEEILAREAVTDVLLPGSDRRRDELPERLAAAAVQVHELTVHETLPLKDVPRDARNALDAGALDLVAAYSPSALEFFRHCAEPLKVVLQALPVACLGETTAGRAAELGFAERIVPAAPGELDLIHEVARWREKH